MFQKEPVKFKKDVEEYMLGKSFKKWMGIKPTEKARKRIKAVASVRNKKDFNVFSGFRLEKIESTENQYSIRLAGQWRCFFIWENNQAWEIEISKHDYKKVKK